MRYPCIGLGTTPLLKPWEVFPKYLRTNPLGTGGGEKAIQKVPPAKGAIYSTPKRSLPNDRWRVFFNH